MALYALEAVDDAWAVTRRFLGDVGRSGWLRLALVVLFLGGPGPGLNSVQYNVGGNQGVPGSADLPPPDADVWLVVAAVVILALLAGLAFAVVAAVMEFVFVESLRAGAVRVRAYWGRRWRQGLRLFGFRVVVGLLVLGGVAAVVALVAVPAAMGAGAAPAALALVVVVPVALLLGLVVALVDGFTTVFVVPVMVLADCGVVAGWRRLWPTVVAAWQQYLAYAVVGAVLSFAGGVAVGILVALLAVVLLVPFGVLAALGVALLSVLEPAGIAVVALAALLYALAVVAVAALVQVPVQTYLRFYALLVLGDVEPEFDLIPDRRAAVRE